MLGCGFLRFIESQCFSSIPLMRFYRASRYPWFIGFASLIDELPEMIGWVKKQKEVKQFTSFETFEKTPKTG